MKSDVLTQLANTLRKSDLRKKYLKPVQTITPLQSAWVRCMLDVWGAKYSGREGPETSKCSVIGRLMIRERCTDQEAGRIIKVVEDLHKQGYSGTELFVKAQQIVLLNSKIKPLLERANEQEEADLVEAVMCKIFKGDNPIRAVAIKYYCERKCSQDIAHKITELTGMHIENSKTRVKWCMKLLEAAVYHGLQREMEVIHQQIAA